MEDFGLHRWWIFLSVSQLAEFGLSQLTGLPCIYPGTAHYPGVEEPTPETADMFAKILGLFDRYLKAGDS